MQVLLGSKQVFTQKMSLIDSKGSCSYGSLNRQGNLNLNVGIDLTKRTQLRRLSSLQGDTSENHD